MSEDSDAKAEMSAMRRSCDGLLHLHDAFGQVGRNLRQAFTAAVHDVVVAGAAGRTHRHLGGTGPGLCLNRTCRRHTTVDETRQSHNESVLSKAPSPSGGRDVSSVTDCLAPILGAPETRQ